MACVDSLLLGVQADCNAIKKVGGLAKRNYLGSIADLATVTFGTGNIITGMTFKSPNTMTGTAISLANPGVVTVASTAALVTGQTVTITANTGATLVGGLTIVGQSFTITVINATTFSIGAETTGVASTGFTMTYPTKGLVQFSGKVDKNSSGSTLEVGENVNVRLHSVNMAVYYSTGLQLQSLDQLIDMEQVFVINETRAGALEVHGINIVNFSAFGMKVSANVGTSGILLNDSTAFQTTLTGGHTNLQLLYNPSVALATNIAALDLLSIDP